MFPISDFQKFGIVINEGGYVKRHNYYIEKIFLFTSKVSIKPNIFVQILAYPHRFI